MEYYCNLKEVNEWEELQESELKTMDLADAIHKGGSQELKKNSSSYEAGKFKCECAAQVGSRMILERNISPSFKYFIGKLDLVCG